MHASFPLASSGSSMVFCLEDWELSVYDGTRNRRGNSCPGKLEANFFFFVFPFFPFSNMSFSRFGHTFTSCVRLTWRLGTQQVRFLVYKAAQAGVFLFFFSFLFFFFFFFFASSSLVRDLSSVLYIPDTLFIRVPRAFAGEGQCKQRSPHV